MGALLGIAPSISLCWKCPCLHQKEWEQGFQEFRNTGGNVVCIIFALDYRYSPDDALTASEDANVMYRICHRAEHQDMMVRVALDDQKTLAGDPYFPIRVTFLRLLKQQAMKCQPGDWFVFFYAGHGINVPDTNHDEASGLDQAFVLPNGHLKLTMRGALIDDEFALALDAFVPLGVRILVLCDCCHSGTICDIDSFRYNHEIYQISAAQDDEEAEDAGRGGTFTTALHEALQALSLQYNHDEFSIQDVFDVTNDRALAKTKEQHLSFQWQGTHPSRVAWPLCYPWSKYLSKPMPNYWFDDRVEVAGDSPAPFYVPRATADARKL